MAFYLSSLTHTHRHTHTHTRTHAHRKHFGERGEISLHRFTHDMDLWGRGELWWQGRSYDLVKLSTPPGGLCRYYGRGSLAGGRSLRASASLPDCVVMTTTRAGGQLATLHNQNTCTHILHNSFIAQNGKEITSFLFCGDLVRWGGGRGRVWWFVN